MDASVLKNLWVDSESLLFSGEYAMRKFKYCLAYMWNVSENSIKEKLPRKMFVRSLKTSRYVSNGWSFRLFHIEEFGFYSAVSIVSHPKIKK